MRRSDFGLSRSQSLMWLGMQQHPGAPIYDMPSSFALEGVLDEATFCQAFAQVVTECDALRTRFVVGTDGAAEPITATKIEDCIDRIGLVDDPAGREFDSWREDRLTRPLRIEDRAFDCALVRTAQERWVWYLNQHHLIADAASTELIYRRTAEVYSALRRGERPAPSVFANSRTGEADRREAARRSRAAKVWGDCADRLAQREPLALFGQTPDLSSTRSARITISLDPARAQAIEALADDPRYRAINRDLTLFQIFMTALIGFLFKASDRRDIVVGVPSANRTSAARRTFVGLLMELYALDLDADPDDDLAALYDRVRRKTLDLLRHAEAETSNAGIARAVNVMLNYVKVSLPRFDGLPVTARFHASNAMEPHYLMRLQINDFEDGGGTTLNFDFDASALSPQLRQLCVDQYLRMLDLLLEAPSKPLGETSLLSEDERLRLVVTLNDTTAAYLDARALPQLIEAKVEEAPNRIAVRDGKVALTYQELDRWSSGLAGRLGDLDLGRGQHVALLLPRSVELVVAMYATLKAGAAYLPVDPDLPEARRDEILSEAKPGATITSHAFRGVASPIVVIEDVDREGVPLRLGAGHAPALEDAAYTLFTSGSTGTPKGVTCTHRGVVNLLLDFQERQAVSPGEVCGWWTSPGFDVSVYEIYSALLYGGTLELVPEDLRADPQGYYNWLVEHDVRSAYVPPFMLPAFRDVSETGQARLSLTRMLVGVEPIEEDLLAGIAAQHPALRIINGYGPTEATICATLYSVGLATQQRRTPIGRAARNTRLYVVDRHGGLVPFGTPGELYIGGDGVALGYLNRPDLEQGSFIEDPFSPGGGRVYRTGDLVRYLPDGNLEFLGRRDHQIKIHGYRIEPAEIERALVAHPGVSQALVLVAQTPEGEKRLVAYLVERGGGKSVTPHDWFQWLKTKLPLYMVPADYIPLSAFPLTASGKIDRKALPVLPSQSRRDRDVPIGLASSPAEMALAQVWSDVLGLEQVGVNERFADLGGDSINAFQIATRAREAGYVVTPRQVFEAQTISLLALSAEAAGQDDTVGTVDSDPRVDGLVVEADLSEDDLSDLLEKFGETL